MRKELNNITFVLLSTMIILLIFAFELNNLVDMLKAGFLDGFGTPLVTDRFMSLGVVRHAVDEPTALVFNMVLTFVLLTFVPMIAELMILPGKGFATPMMAGAIGYAAAAVILMIFRLKEND